MADIRLLKEIYCESWKVDYRSVPALLSLLEYSRNASFDNVVKNNSFSKIELPDELDDNEKNNGNIPVL